MLGRGRKGYSSFFIRWETVPNVCYASCQVMVVMRHSGRFLHMRGKCRLTADVIFAHGVGWI